MKRPSLENELKDMFHKKIANLIKRLDIRTETAKYYRKLNEQNAKACMEARKIANKQSKQLTTDGFQIERLKGVIQESADLLKEEGFSFITSLKATIRNLITSRNQWRGRADKRDAEIERLSEAVGEFVLQDRGRAGRNKKYRNLIEGAGVKKGLSSSEMISAIAKLATDEKAKASKLTAQKRKVMQLWDRQARGYMTYKEAMSDYNKWLKAQRSSK